MIKKKNIYLVGGGEILFKLSKELIRSKDLSVFCLISKRHSAEIINENTLKKNLTKNNIPFKQISNINSYEFKNLSKDSIIISISCPWIIDEKILNLFKFNVFNMHGTRLPRDGGGGNITWQILRGNKRGCVLIHQIDNLIDTGPIVSYKEFDYRNCEIPSDYYRVYNKFALELLKKFIDKITQKNRLTLYKQTPFFQTYFPRLSTKIHGYIDWSLKIEYLYRFICAFDDPYQGAHTFIKNKKVHLKKAFIDYEEHFFHPFQYGIAYYKNSEYISICANGGSIHIKDLFDNNGKKIKIDDIALGSRFYTPIKYLESAKIQRIFYDH